MQMSRTKGAEEDPLPLPQITELVWVEGGGGLTGPAQGYGGLEDALAPPGGVGEDGEVGVHEPGLLGGQCRGLDDLCQHAGDVVGAVLRFQQRVQLVLQQDVLHRCDKGDGVNNGRREKLGKDLPISGNFMILIWV